MTTTSTTPPTFVLPHVLIGTEAICRSVASSADAVAKPNRPELMPAAAKYTVILDALRPEELETLPLWCKQLCALHPTAAVSISTLSALKKEVDSAAWTAKNGTTFVGLTHPLDEPLVPCLSWATDPSSSPTLKWYNELVDFALALRHPTRGIVLHGPSGVGKTLAVERIQQIMEKNAQTIVRSGRAPMMLIVSVANVDSDNCELTMRNMRVVGNRSPFNVVVLDDYDAKTTPKLLECLNNLECRRIVICNNLYAPANRILRNERLFQPLAVNRAHPLSLANYLVQKFPALLRDQAAAIAQVSNGDVRAALITAKWQETSIKRTMLIRNGAPDASKIGETPHAAIQRCLAAPNVRFECDRTFGEGDVETPAQLLFENHARFNPTDLEAAARLCELQSFGDTYEHFSRQHAFDGTDAHQMDKRVHFDLAFIGPCQTIASGVRRAGVPRVPFQRSQEPLGRPKLAFPFSSLYNKARAAAIATRRAEMHMKLQSGQIDVFDRASLDEVVENGLSKTAITESTADWMGVLFVLLKPERLARCLKAATEKRPPTTNAEQAALEKYDAELLTTTIKRFGSFGLDAKDFAFLCSRRVALCTDKEKHKLPSPSEIAAVYQKVNPTIVAGDAELVITSRATGAPRGRKRKTEASNDEPKVARPPPQKRNSLLSSFMLQARKTTAN